jgi:hypothetical protein
VGGGVVGRPGPLLGHGWSTGDEQGQRGQRWRRSRRRIRRDETRGIDVLTAATGHVVGEEPVARSVEGTTSHAIGCPFCKIHVKRSCGRHDSSHGGPGTGVALFPTVKDHH